MISRGSTSRTATDLSNVERLSDSLSADYLEEHLLLPLAVDGARLLVAHAGRPDAQAVNELAALFGAQPSLIEVAKDPLLAAVRRAYGPQTGTAAELIASLQPETAGKVQDTALEANGLVNEPPVIRLVNLLLREAVEARASDVHLEDEGDGLRVRYRIDGVLHDAPSPPPHLRSAVVSRVKIMAELDIAERRVPQDGRVRLRIDNRDIDVRVSTLPVLRGESVVLRLLDADRERLTIGALGMADDTRDAVLLFGSRPQGVLLSTGPTGCGKTTTLYALLERIRTGQEKIVSVEDPVEYELTGVAQVPVRMQTGLSFARALRSILRQDPDVILVGEMRDAETAEICVQASLTGHLVLSTLHTNDAPSALTRMLHLGVPDYLLTSTVELVLAQRLVRKTCVECSEESPAGDAAERAMEADGWDVSRVRRGRGCGACRETGFRGRTGIYELLVVDEDIRSELLNRRGSRTIRQLALQRGMRALRADGWRQVQAGVTTPEEVLRVTAA